MLPSLGMLLLSTTGRLFDYIRSKHVCSVSHLRKMFNGIAFFAPAVCFSILSFLPCHEKVSWLKLFYVTLLLFIFVQVAHVALLALGLTLHELAMTGGFYFSHSELAGPYSGILFGITNTFAQIPGFLTPLLVSHMTKHVSTLPLTSEVLILHEVFYRAPWQSGTRSSSWLDWSIWWVGLSIFSLENVIFNLGLKTPRSWRRVTKKRGCWRRRKSAKGRGLVLVR